MYEKDSDGVHTAVKTDDAERTGKADQSSQAGDLTDDEELIF